MIHSGNFYLSRSQMEDNATYIYGFMLNKGWTLNAICGMQGNMETESTINPAIWQNLDQGNTSLGFGLVQWTPATKYLDWCSNNGLTYTEMDSNLKRILYEVENNLQWIATNSYNFSFYEFTQSNKSPYELGLAFLANYERPKNPNQPQRGTQANEWYQFLTGVTPPDPDPHPPFISKSKIPIYMMLRKF